MKLRAMMLSLLALASVACPAHAEDAADYPSKKIKMLLPFGAGGGGDVLGRLLADRMGNVSARPSTSKTAPAPPAPSARSRRRPLRPTATPSRSAA